MQFVIAETSTDAVEQHTAYLNGIRASFEELSLGNAEFNAYVAQSEIDPGSGNLTMDQIMTQKYIAMFVQPEAFSDWRRTAIPNISPPSNANSDVVARRWFYPENEYLFNSNAPARDDDLIFNRVDWDIN
jgi:hypothetical protein